MPLEGLNLMWAQVAFDEESQAAFDNWFYRHFGISLSYAFQRRELAFILIHCKSVLFLN
jgi:hypothetical protein